ncbi:hypothetical protein HRbin29_00308 [bacterium HR29]|jgi:hypothetical protein|nr:hypothetical protein HRbin29_00308 [bacterium HR29]
MDRLAGLWRWYRGRRRRTQWLLGVGAAVVILAIVSAASGSGGEESSAPPAAPADATPMATATATPTPTPTNTPTPAPSPTPTPDEGEAAYRAALLRELPPISDALTELGRLMSEAGEQPTRILQSDWRFNVAAQLAVIQVGADRIRGLTPPPRFADAHADLAAAMDLLDEASTELARGIDTLDAARITRAADLLRQATEKIQSATAKLPRQ